MYDIEEHPKIEKKKKIIKKLLMSLLRSTLFISYFILLLKIKFKYSSLNI
jgi:hypothetical protein